MLLRQIHAYIGALIAPSLLFFAFTGALQLFSLHEAHGNYQPPAIIERLARVHKDQVFSLGRHHKPTPAPASAAAPAGGGGDADADRDHADHDRADRDHAGHDGDDMGRGNGDRPHRRHPGLAGDEDGAADHAGGGQAAQAQADQDHPPGAQGPGGQGAGKGGDHQPALKTYLLKWFFLVVALGLFVTTLIGVWIGLTRRRGRVLSAALLVVGAALPVLLLVL